MYCASCSAAVQLESELEARRLQGSLDEANTKLSAMQLEKAQLANEATAKLSALESEKARLTDEARSQLSLVECEKARLAELLQKKEQEAAELQEQFNSVSLELEKALRYRALLDWLEPALHSMQERLEALERTQNSLNQTMLQLIQRIGETRKNFSLLGVFRRILRPHWKSPASNG